MQYPPTPPNMAAMQGQMSAEMPGMMAQLGGPELSPAAPDGPDPIEQLADQIAEKVVERLMPQAQGTPPNTPMA